MWETSYLAASVLLGDVAEEALARLDDAGRARCRPLADVLARGSREQRARAIAAEVARIAQAADRGVLA